jgi:hypothetical protein
MPIIMPQQIQRADRTLSFARFDLEKNKEWRGAVGGTSATPVNELLDVAAMVSVVSMIHRLPFLDLTNFSGPYAYLGWELFIPSFR